VRAGVVAALVAGVAGYAVERVRFGGSDQAALDRVQVEIRDRFERSAASLSAIATRVAANPEAGSSAPRDPAGIRRLFDLVATALPQDNTRRTGVTVYDTAAASLAWAGRVSDLPKERVQGPAAMLIAPSALGPRLIRVEPITADGVRVSTVVAEQSLGMTEEAPGLVDTFVMQTSTVQVTLRLGAAAAPAATSPYRFVVPARDSPFVLEAEVAPADLAASRARWRSITWATMLCIVGAAVLLSMGPLVDMRRRTRETSHFLVLTAALIVIVVCVRVIVYFALAPIAPTPEPTPLDLFLTTVTMASVVWLVLDLIERRRAARPRPRLLMPTSGAMATIAAGYAAAGFGACWLLWAYEGFLKRVVADTTLDLLHFSLHPLSASRIAIEFALVLLHSAIVWGAVAILRLPPMLWRTPRSGRWRLIATAGWLAGTAAGVGIVRAAGPPVPIGPLAIALAAVGLSAVALARVGGRLRRMSQSGRLAVFFIALLTPAVAMYPSLLAHATEAKERLVATEFGSQAATLREDLQRRLQQAVEQIDAIPSLADFVNGSSADTP